MSNYQKLIERVAPFFEREGFKKKDKTTFTKKEGEAEYYFHIESYQGGYSAKCTYGVYLKLFNQVFCKILNKRDFKDTIFFRTENGGIEKDFKRFILESDQDIEDNIQRTIKLYQDYAVPFFELNDTYPKILATLRKSKGIPRTNGNPDHTLVTETAMLMDLFLTRLLREGEYEDRAKHYLHLLEEAKENNIKEHGQPGAFAMYIQTIQDGMAKMATADWPLIREKLSVT